ncbi:unnamed protein product [Rotaria socialis]
MNSFYSVTWWPLITDYSIHITAIALPNCTAQTTAEALFNEHFCKYGIPVTIISDDRLHFNNQLTKNIRHFVGAIATLIPQIFKLQDMKNNNWDIYLQAVVFACNSDIHKTAKYSPYELHCGRQSCLSIH